MKVDLLVQVAKEDHEHQSHQLQLDILLQAEAKRQYTTSANTAGNHPVGADERLLPLGNAF